STAITGSEVFVSGRNIGTIKSIVASDHEVTQGEYETYCIYGGTDKPTNEIGKGVFYPAYYVNWYDAIVYCNLRSIAEGYTPVYSIDGKTNPAEWPGIVSGTELNASKYCGPSERDTDWDAVVFDTTADGWRLPTEIEWEYLARGGNLTNSGQTTYSGSNNVGDVAYYSGNADSKTHYVKQKQSNALQIYDMTGNVFEWCYDWFTSPLSSAIGNTGPTYEQANTGKEKVFCGGAYSKDASNCSISKRGWYQPPQNRFSDMGFRVVRGSL
ncbi:MAG: formylglycine-generating enzyme family protein, partial [Treponemataceae bacterium]|nr:formylglycine-generating enzyme family protein [Treponemataceae bacterium]